MKQQVVIIHGGDTFETYEAYWKYLESCELTLERINAKNWKDYLHLQLPSCEVIYPKMPNSKNARYPEWKLWFEKLIPLLHDGVILVGHSLGGIFLAKYLAENNFPLGIKALYLIAAPYDDKDCDYPLADFALTNHLENLAKQVGKIYLYQSRDDLVVPFVDVEKYKKDLSGAELVIFEDRGHFNQETFPELVDSIKLLAQ